MIIYEVNLMIDSEIYSQFQSWLSLHAKEMLGFPGFIQAIILKPETEQISDQEIVTIHYQLNDRAALERYLVEFAPKMREQGLALFKNKFSAQRRVFEVQEIILKD